MLPPTTGPGQERPADEGAWMLERRSVLLALATAGALVVAASPAMGAVQGAPSAKAQLHKGNAAARVANAAEGPGEDGGDEAESLQARTEYEQAITAAPDEIAPAEGLAAAIDQAGSLPA